MSELEDKFSTFSKQGIKFNWQITHFQISYSFLKYLKFWFYPMLPIVSKCTKMIKGIYISKLLRNFLVEKPIFKSIHFNPDSNLFFNKAQI